MDIGGIEAQIERVDDLPLLYGMLKQMEIERVDVATGDKRLALAAVLAQPWATLVLQRDNLQALQVAWDAEAAQNLAGLAETPGEYWSTRSQLAWN